MTRSSLVPLVSLVVIAAIVWALMTLFQTENVATPPDSTTTIVTSVDTRVRFQQPLQSAAEALVLTCLAEIPSDVVEDVQRIGETDDFRVTVRPALDEDDAAKVRGCLNDFVVPSVLGGVTSLEHTGRDD